MALRTTSSTVTFTRPFTLRGNGETFPPGSYEVETDEEIIEGNERTVYRRAATLLHIRSPGMTRTVTIDPEDLERALADDRESRRQAPEASD